jgi:hypothetical protein
MACLEYRTPALMAAALELAGGLPDTATRLSLFVAARP